MNVNFPLSPVVSAVVAFIVYVWLKKQEEYRNQQEDSQPSVIYSATQNAKNFFTEIKKSLKRPLTKSYDEFIISTAPNQTFVPTRNPSLKQPNRTTSLLSNINRNQSLLTERKPTFSNSLSFVQPEKQPEMKESPGEIANKMREKKKEAQKPTRHDLRDIQLDSEDKRPKKKTKTEEISFLYEESLPKEASNPMSLNVSNPKPNGQANGKEKFSMDKNILDFYRQKNNYSESSEEESEYLVFDKNKFFGKNVEKEKDEKAVSKNLQINDNFISSPIKGTPEKPKFFAQETKPIEKKKEPSNEPFLSKILFQTQPEKKAPLQEKEDKKISSFPVLISDSPPKIISEKVKEEPKPAPKEECVIVDEDTLNEKPFGGEEDDDPLKKYEIPHHSSIFTGGVEPKKEEPKGIFGGLFQKASSEKEGGSTGIFGGIFSGKGKEEGKPKEDKGEDIKKDLFGSGNIAQGNFSTPSKSLQPVNKTTCPVNTPITPHLNAPDTEEPKEKKSLFGNLMPENPISGKGYSEMGLFGNTLPQIPEVQKESSSQQENPFGRVGSLGLFGGEMKEGSKEEPSKGLFGNLGGNLQAVNSVPIAKPNENAPLFGAPTQNNPSKNSGSHTGLGIFGKPLKENTGASLFGNPPPPSNETNEQPKANPSIFSSLPQGNLFGGNQTGEQPKQGLFGNLSGTS